MKTALLSIIENAFVGNKPHEATFILLTLEDGSTAPLGRAQRVAVASQDAALEWAVANSIRVVQGVGTEVKPRALIHLNDEAGVAQFSVELACDIGTWLDSFPDREQAEHFIKTRNLSHNPATDFRDTRCKFPG